MNAAVKPLLEVADIDPALAGFLAQAAAQGNPPIESLPPTIARQIYRGMADTLGLPTPAIGKVEETPAASPWRVTAPARNWPWWPRGVCRLRMCVRWG